MRIVYSLSSFGSKSDNRVEMGGAAGGKKAGGRGYKGKDQCDANEDERIIRADLEEQTAHESGQAGGGKDACDESKKRRPHPLPNDQREHVAPVAPRAPCECRLRAGAVRPSRK